MSGWVQQRGSRFRGLYRDSTGKNRTAGTFQYRFQAQEAADAAELEDRTGVSPALDPAELTVTAYAERWLKDRTAIRVNTRTSYRNAVVNHVGPKLGDLLLVPPTDAEERKARGEDETWLSRARVRAWVAGMEADPAVGPAARNYAVKVLRMVIKSAIGDELLAKDPTAGIKRQKSDIAAPRAFMSDEQISDLLQAAETLSWVNSPKGGRRVTLPPDGMLRLAILLGVDAGLRWEEIAALDLASVQTVGSRTVLYVHRSSDRKGRIENTTKNGEPRHVPVTTDRLRRALSLRTKQARLEHGPDSLLIYREDGSAARYEHWKRVLLDGAYAEAGITAQGWHDLRHTYGSRLAEKGVATKIIATLMGHSEEDITQLYLHPSTTEHLALVVGSALTG